MVFRKFEEDILLETVLSSVYSLNRNLSPWAEGKGVRTSKIRTSKVIFDFRCSFRRSDQPLHFSCSEQFKKDFQRSDPFQIFDQLLYFRGSDFRRSDPFLAEV